MYDLKYYNKLSIKDLEDALNSPSVKIVNGIPYIKRVINYSGDITYMVFVKTGRTQQKENYVKFSGETTLLYQTHSLILARNKRNGYIRSLLDNMIISSSIVI